MNDPLTMIRWRVIDAKEKSVLLVINQVVKIKKRSPGASPSIHCQHCHRVFFGALCLSNHLLYRDNNGVPADSAFKNSVCDSHKRCLHCNKTLTKQELKSGHTCGFSDCPACKEYVNTSLHQCYLQLVKEDKQKGKKGQKRKPPAEADNSNVFETAVSEDNDEEEYEPLPPIFVYFDIEAMQDGGKQEVDHHIMSQSCFKQLTVWKIEADESEDRQHNFKGYDRYFIVDEFYKQGVRPDQLVNRKFA